MKEAQYMFRGQCYDAGSLTDSKCALCKKPIRYCFVLKAISPATPSLTIGSCCFDKFKGDDDLYTALLGSNIWLETTLGAVDTDQKVYNDRIDVQERIRQWNAVKKQARTAIRKHKKEAKGDYLPENLYRAEQLLRDKAPEYKRQCWRLRWYERRIETMKGYLQ